MIRLKQKTYQSIKLIRIMQNYSMVLMKDIDKDKMIIISARKYLFSVYFFLVTEILIFLSPCIYLSNFIFTP